MRRYRARKRGEDIPLGKPGPRPARVEATISAHPGRDRGYALDFSSPVRYVATELERSGSRGCSVAEMAATYSHIIGADLTRVRLHHGLASDAAAKTFLIDRALSALGEQCREARGSGRYRLARAFEDLRYEGSPIYRYE